MKRNFLLTLVVFTTLAFSNAFAQQTAKMSPKGTGFLQYLPDGYSSNTNKYPIVISLHGIREKGNTLTDVQKVANVGLPKYVKYGAKYSFILISPQLKTTMGRWTGDYVIEVLNYVKTYLRVDPSRIYLTGLSLGGGGVWSVSTAYPSVWAAILPICSGYNLTSLAAQLGNNDVPTWGFHGDADTVVPESVTINMINSINNYKPTPTAKVTIFPGLGHIIWDKVYKETTSLSWMLSHVKGSTGGSTTTTNAAPIANAGSDKTLTLPTNSTTIYGGGSDSDGSIVSYSWVKKSGGSVSLSGTTSKDLKTSSMVAGTYVFSLTVKDDKGASDSDDVTVIVKSSTTTNYAPVVNAGSDRLIVLPTNATSITASASDRDGSIASYQWSKIAGPSCSLSGTTYSTLKVSSMAGGTYTFRVTVKDNDGAVDTDDIIVNVDRAPTVSAGADRTVTLPLSSLTLTGTASDADGSIVSYQWSKYSGPTLLMSNSTSKTATISNLVAGTYVFKFAAKDDKGAVAYDYVKIVVANATASIEHLNDPNTVLAALDRRTVNDHIAESAQHSAAAILRKTKISV
jgi:poly(3-hydroxybutyrate) depolymerase